MNEDNDQMNVMQIGDIELRLWPGMSRPPASDDRTIYLFKDRSFLNRIEAVADRIKPKRMIEVGILDGGSTIYWQNRYQPERLITFDIEPEAPSFVQYLKRHDLDDIVRTYFGVSQDNGPALRAAILESTTFPLVDLIIDDASHQYAETRASVETLLPFLRPGGAYIVEDWAWGHQANWPPAVWADCPLMSPLLSELMLVCGSGAGVIDRIEINPNFFVLWRGELGVDNQGRFKLADHYASRGFLAAL